MSDEPSTTQTNQRGDIIVQDNFSGTGIASGYSTRLRKIDQISQRLKELAFYGAMATNYLNLYDETFLRDLIHDPAQTIKRNLKVDWTQLHREDEKAAVRAAVKRVLRRRNVRAKDFELGESEQALNPAKGALKIFQQLAIPADHPLVSELQAHVKEWRSSLQSGAQISELETQVLTRNE